MSLHVQLLLSLQRGVHQFQKQYSMLLLLTHLDLLQYIEGTSTTLSGSVSHQRNCDKLTRMLETSGLADHDANLVSVMNCDQFVLKMCFVAQAKFSFWGNKMTSSSRDLDVLHFLGETLWHWHLVLTCNTASVKNRFVLTDSIYIRH